ncbi:MAG: ABC transporter permease [Lachnospiraceae bacterium]|nr:ABC transporter permease [Lachnospiraceae bacterium]
MKKILERRETGVFLILAILCFMLSIISPAFLSYTNIKNVLVNNVPLGIMAGGMTFVLITAGIDTSVASQMMFSATWISIFVTKSPLANPVTVLLLAAVIGLCTGAVNGFLISKFSIAPIIVTLGTASIYRGIILVYTNGTWIMNLPDWFTNLCRTWNMIPLPVVYTILIFVISAYILKRTYFGRSVYAIGGNRNAAKYAGVNIGKTIFLTYTYCGLMCGIAGLVIDSILGNCQPSGSTGWEMNAIAAAVIGGTNILGGSGTMAGTAIGVVMMGVIENGLVVAHIPTYYQKLVYGLIILVTVTFDVIRKNFADSRKQTIEMD